MCSWNLLDVISSSLCWFSVTRFIVICVLDMKNDYYQIHLGIAMYVECSFYYYKTVWWVSLNEDEYYCCIKWMSFRFYLFMPMEYLCVKWIVTNFLFFPSIENLWQKHFLVLLSVAESHIFHCLMLSFLDALKLKTSHLCCLWRICLNALECLRKLHFLLSGVDFSMVWGEFSQRFEPSGKRLFAMPDRVVLGYPLSDHQESHLHHFLYLSQWFRPLEKPIFVVVTLENNLNELLD